MRIRAVAGSKSWIIWRKLDVASARDAMLAAEADITSGMKNKSCINYTVKNIL